MQRNSKKYIIVFVIALLGVGLTAGIVKKVHVDKKQKKDDEIKVGMTLYNAKDTFVENIEGYVEYYINLLEEEKGINIVLDVVDGKNNQELQNGQIDEFIKQGYDVILANTVDRADASMIIDKVQKAKGNIIFFNREPVPQDMKKWEKTYYVGSSAEQAGSMQGEILVEAIANGLDIDKNKDGKIQYVMIEGEYGHQDAILRTYHCIKTLEDNGFKMDNLGTDTARWLRVEGKEKMKEWLNAFGDDIEIVLANNDEMALGAIEALKEQGYFEGQKWMPVIGVDGIDEALESIEEGTMVGTVFNDSNEQAKCIVKKLYDCLATEEEETSIMPSTEEKSNYFWVNHKKITKENVKEIKKHNLIHKK